VTNPDTIFTADYIVIGGGTSGCIVAARLSEDPATTVSLLEWGPSDEHEPRAHSISRWAEMLEGAYDFDYRSVPQERGNSDIRMSRLGILGGCSTANTMITWRPLRGDLDEWVALGAEGWDPETLWPCFDRLLAKISIIPEKDRNPYLQQVVDSAAIALKVPIQESWNDKEFTAGAGYFEIGYDPETNIRSSTSISYVHPIGDSRPNIDIALQTRALKLELTNNVVTGVLVRRPDGTEQTLRARREIILCGGAIDSPRLLQLSGIGPRDVLEAAGVECLIDLPGVGANLQDHAEGVVIWETEVQPGPVRATGWDAGYVVTLDAGNNLPDISTHIPLETWGTHVENHGVVLPELTLSLAPNVCKPRSRGKVWITSADPDAAPAIDYRYFTDADGHDEAMLVAGVRLARLVAATEPFASLVGREVFPGAAAQTDAEISELARATHQTVYHVSGTCKIGRQDDPSAVLDPQLRVRGVIGLRVVDASVFPTITALNPVGTVMSVAERAVELIRADR
jgi:choline dehydrogenase-like flavoprotein